MIKIYEDNFFIIGNIFLVWLKNLMLYMVLVKIESCNLAFFVKCCIGVNMVW